MKSRLLLSAISLIVGPALAMDVSIQVVDTKGVPVADAVVFLPESGAKSKPVGRPKAVMDQRGREFVPHVLPIQTGTEVTFPNSDNIHHHVYSFAGVKHFELPLYKNGQRPKLIFGRPGAVPLGCNIHDWMLGYIYVVDTPYFAKTDASGQARISGVPDRAGRVQVWHPRLMEGEVPMPGQAIKPGQTVRMTLSLKPERPRRRPPVSGEGNVYSN